MKSWMIAVTVAAAACSPSATPVAEPQPTGTTVESGGGRPLEAPAGAGGHADAGSHTGATAACEEIAKACHDVGHGPGEAGTCHEIGHKGDATACEKEHHRCIALCEAAAKGGGAHGGH